MRVTRTASGIDLATSDRPAAAVAWYAEAFSDRLGDRLLLFDNAGPGLELLRFSPTLTSVDGFEASVRARVEQCAGFAHPAFAPVRSLTVLDDPHPQLALVSEHAPGERVSGVLRTARQAGNRLHPDSAIWLLRQVTPALAALQRQRPGSAHGCLTPERIVIAPTGDAIVTEYVLGPAIERLNLDRSALWREFGVLAGTDGAPALIGPRVDVVQLALIVLALLLGRPLRADELPAGVTAVVDAACAAPEVARSNLRAWIERALGIVTPGFANAREACEGLDALLPGLAGSWASTAVPQSSVVVPSQALAPTSRLTTLGLHRDAASIPRRLALPAPKGDPVVVARRLRWVSVVLGAVALAEAAALVFLLTRPGQPPDTSSAVAASTSRSVVAPAATGPAEVPAQSAGAGLTTASRSTIRRARSAAPAPRPGPHDAADAADPQPVIGWVAVQSDVEMRVYVNGRLLGSAAHGRFRLPAGEHDITLVNESIGLRSTHPVRVIAGRTAIVTPPSR